jgi:hypothetical protein
MEPMTIFAICGCLLSGGVVYVVLKVSHAGESQTLADQLLKTQTELAATKKKLLGHTKFVDYLGSSCVQALADILKPPVVKVLREYVHVEKLAKDTYRLKADATVIVKYAVEFAFALDLSAESLVVEALANGVSLKISRPSLRGDPVIKTLSDQVISSLDLPDKSAVMADIQTKFASVARMHGLAMSSEEGLRLQCKVRAMEGFRDVLAKQAGVTHPPAVYVDFK